MKKMMTLLAMILLVFAGMFSQNELLASAQDEDLDSFQFDSEPIQEESIPYFGLGVGYVGTFMYLNFDELNKHLAANKFFNDKKFEVPVFLSGVHGFTAIGIIPNLRIGFYGMGGETTLQESLKINDKDYKQNYDITVTYTAITVDYAIVPMKSLAILPGVGFGWGLMDMDNYRTAGDVEWNNFNNNAPDDESYFKKTKSSFFYVQPSLNVEYALTPFTTVRLGVNYSYSFAYDWSYNSNSKLKNVPSAINANGLGVQFGIFVGLFN